jgi:hypothetical protein
MKKKLVLTLVASFLLSGAYAQLKTFKTAELRYANCSIPAEEFRFTWDEASGKVTDFYWNRGGTIYFLHANPSRVVRDERTLYDYHVYLNVTTKGYESTAYQIRGKVTMTAMRKNGAVFGGFYEGTGVNWMAAEGVYEK